MILLPPISTLFPYTTLFRSFIRSFSARAFVESGMIKVNKNDSEEFIKKQATEIRQMAINALPPGEDVTVQDIMKDRKSTRLNSSHANISYAVFCLKKKKKNK